MLAVQPDGRIVLVGGVGSEQRVFLVARFTHGRIDSSFGDGGSTVTTFTSGGWT